MRVSTITSIGAVTPVKVVDAEPAAIEFQAFAWRSATLVNQGGVAVHFGGADLTAANKATNGVSVAASESYTVPSVYDDIYALADSSTVSVKVVAH